MASYLGANVTKYDAGGSGDNIISDGYIKTVEKVWLDSYTFTAVINTGDTITIARIPPNKKITGVEVFFPAITPTTTTIAVGTVANPSAFISSGSVMKLGTSGTAIANTGLVSNTGTFYATTGTSLTAVIFSIYTANITAPTGGTIYTKVSYT